METKIYDLLRVDQYNEAIREASEAISDGGIVVFPTETVYGLGANALDPKAVEKIFIAKGRPNDNPLIVHIARAEDIFVVASHVSEDCRKLMEAFMPGPISIVVPKSEKIPYCCTAGLETVAVRCPLRREARDFIAACKVPIAAPSANISHKPSPTLPEHVLTDMLGKADVILTAGGCDIGLESTVVDITGSKPAILRPGAITPAMISEVLGKKTVRSYEASSSDTPKAPGMKYSHYKPEAHLICLHAPKKAADEYINARISSEELAKKGKVACAVFDSQKPDCENTWYLGKPEEKRKAASLLFNYLRRCDSEGITTAFFMCDEQGEEGEAYANRLHKAADEIVYL
ncbi:MAG: threonylcarbamoyl-AMP synthase [Eubacteriaceae bacterium]|nr:threonylcarbamoyl-AMP synthase [Eubacteriaceae bacterium]